MRNDERNSLHNIDLKRHFLYPGPVFGSRYTLAAKKPVLEVKTLQGIERNGFSRTNLSRIVRTLLG